MSTLPRERSAAPVRSPGPGGPSPGSRPSPIGEGCHAAHQQPDRPRPRGERFARLLAPPGCQGGSGPPERLLPAAIPRGSQAWGGTGTGPIHLPHEPRWSAAAARDLRGSDERISMAPDDTLAAFAPPPPVLSPAATSDTGTSIPVGSGLHHAQAAALAERLVTSFRIGRVGRDRHQVRLRLAGGRNAALEVRLELEHGRLRAALIGERSDRSEAERLAAGLERELAARGLSLEACELELE